MQFTLGVTYWPRRTGLAMWERFDAGEIREDFARIADLGLDTVRFFLRWDAFAPSPDRADGAMLERFERVLAIAAEYRLQTIPVLFCGEMMGATFLPAWALAARPPGAAFDLYRGPMLDAQLRFAEQIGERGRAHPAIAAWDIGHAFSALSRPSSVRVFAGEHSSAPADEPEIATWSRRLTATLRAHSDHPSTAGTSAADLTEDRSIRLGTLCAPFAFASMQGATVDLPFARGRLDPEAVPFLAMLTASFSYKPVLVTGLGNPTCPGEKFSAFERFAAPGERPNPAITPDDSAFATYPCLTELEAAAYATAVLERLHADGRRGALWWCWADLPDDGTPAQIAAHERVRGIVRRDGSERPVAAALAAFAARRLEVRSPDEMPMIASVYYYRTLPKSTRTLYDAYLRFVAERRSAR
jgi:hypothetical protein